jgi:hypothetical protein
VAETPTRPQTPARRAPNTGFVAALPYLYENVARMI